MKKIYLLFLALFAVNISFGQNPRLQLIEETTGENCAPCAAVNPSFNALLDANPLKIVAIKYQSAHGGPSSGPYPLYAANKTDVDARNSYYSNTSAPSAVHEGNVFTGHPGNFKQSNIDARGSVTSPLTIKVTHKLNAAMDSIFVNCVIKASAAVSGTLKGHIVIIEREILFTTSPGTNGEKKFESVMKKMLPSATGTTVANMAIGDSVVIDQKWKLAGVYNKEELAVVAFVQNNANKSVIQAGYSAPIAKYSNEIKPIEVLMNPTGLTCGNSMSPKIAFRNLGGNTLTKLTVKYSINGGPLSTYDWSGSVPFRSYDTIALPAITYTNLYSNNKIKIYTVNPNDVMDEVATNDTVTKTFNTKVSTDANIKLTIKTDDFPEETSWEIKNSSGNVLYSGKGIGHKKTTLETFYNLPNDCYEFILKDSQKDGIIAGTYKLTSGTNVVIYSGSGNAFTSESIVPFEVQNSVVNTNDVSLRNLVSDPIMENAICGTLISPTIKVVNKTQSPLTSLTFKYRMNSEPEATYNWTGNLGLYASQTVTLPALSFTNTMKGEKLLIYAMNPNGIGDQIAVDDSIRKTFNTVYSDTTLKLSVKTDDYGSEISWSMVSSNGDTIAKSKSYPDGSVTTFDTTMVLSAGCYFLRVTDGYGDGIPGGYVKITDLKNKTIATTTGSYYVMQTDFTNDNKAISAGISGTNKTDLISVFPNPFNEKTSINLQLGEKNSVSYEMFNILGEKIASVNKGILGMGDHKLEIDGSLLNPGVYVLNIRIGEKVTTKKLTVK